MSQKIVRSVAGAALLCGSALMVAMPVFAQQSLLSPAQGSRAGQPAPSAVQVQVESRIQDLSAGTDPTNVRESLGGTLRAAVAAGVKNNPEYKAAHANRYATEQELRQGRAGYLPSVDVNANLGYENVSNNISRGRNNGDDDNLFRSQASLTVTQMLFDGFETNYEVDRQRARVSSSSHRIDETTELVGIRIVQFYLDVLRQRYLSSISQENVDDHREILEQIEAGVQAGRSTQADYEQAAARLAQAQATRADILEALEIAESQYYREVGTEPGALVMPTIPYNALRATLEDEITYALANSPTLNIFESDIEAAYAQARQTQAAYYPDVDLELSTAYGDHLNGNETYNRNATALMVMNWNLYRGGGDVAREREFRYRHEQAKAQYADAARDLEDEIRRTWAQMIAAGTRAEKFASQAKANEQVVQAYADQFTLNRRTLLDVLDAQNELFVSKNNKINAEFQQMFSVYRIIGLRGELLEVLQIDVPDARVVDTSLVEWKEGKKLRAR